MDHTGGLTCLSAAGELRVQTALRQAGLYSAGLLQSTDAWVAEGLLPYVSQPVTFSTTAHPSFWDPGQRPCLLHFYLLWVGVEFGACAGAHVWRSESNFWGSWVWFGLVVSLPSRGSLGTRLSLSGWAAGTFSL